MYNEVIPISLTTSFNYAMKPSFLSAWPLGSKQGDHGFGRPGDEQPILHPDGTFGTLGTKENHQKSRFFQIYHKRKHCDIRKKRWFGIMSNTTFLSALDHILDTQKLYHL